MKKFIILTAFICGFLVSNAQSYTYIAQRYDWLAGLFRALGFPAGDGPAEFQPGQRQRAGSVYYDSTGVDKGVYVWDGTAWVLQGGGTNTAPDLRTIPNSAFADPFNHTKREADIYIDANFTGTDRLGLWQAVPDSLYAINRRQIVADNTLYNAFPGIAVSKRTGTIVIEYFTGQSHALNSAPTLIISKDRGRTWSKPIVIPTAIRKTGSDYKGMSIAFDPVTNRLWGIYENGIGNTLGLNPRISDVVYSDDEGLTWTFSHTIDMTALFAYRASTQGPANGQITITSSGKWIIPIYGLQANNSNFEAGYLWSTDKFVTWTYVPYTQTPATHKFNEQKILEVGDTIYFYIRSEATLGPYLYRAISTDDAVSVSTPAAVTYTGISTRPDMDILPDGRLFMTQRRNNTLRDGVVFLSSDMGLNWTAAGLAHPEYAGFLYSAILTVGDEVYMVYARAPEGVGYTSGNRAGLYLATWPVNNRSIFMRDENGTTVLQSHKYGFDLSKQYKGFTETADSLEAEKPVEVNDLVTHGNLKNNQGTNPYRDITNTDVRSSTYNSSLNKGVPGWMDTLIHRDSITITGRFVSACYARNGYMYLGNNFTNTSFLKVHPYTHTVTSITSSAHAYNGIAAYLDSVWCIPATGTTAKVINIWTDAVSNYTMPSGGWDGGANIAGGSLLWLSKRTSSNTVAYIDMKTRVWTEITIPITDEWTVGGADDKYQYFFPSNSSTIVRVNLVTKVPEVLFADLGATGLTRATIQSYFDGERWWLSSFSGNTIFIFNPSTLESQVITLPSGAYPGLTGNGNDVVAINRTGQNVVKINKKTFEQKVVNLTGATAATYNYMGLLISNRYYLIPDQAGKINILESPELGPDPLQAIYDLLSSLGGTPTFQTVLTAGSTLTTSNNIILGSNGFDFTGVRNSTYSVQVTNTGTLGIAFRAVGSETGIIGVGVTGIIGQSSSGTGIYGAGTSSATGVSGTAIDGVAYDGSVSPSSSNTIVEALRIARYNGGGAGANGIGAAYNFYVETTTTPFTKAGGIEFYWSNATHTSRESRIKFKGIDNAVEETFMEIQKDEVIVNAGADTLSTKAYARGFGGGGSTVTTSPGLFEDTLTINGVNSSLIDRTNYKNDWLSNTPATTSTTGEANRFVDNKSGTGAALTTNLTAPTGVSGMGFLKLSAGTTTTGRAAINYTNQNFLQASGRTLNVAWNGVVIDNLSDGTETFSVNAGIYNPLATRAIYFRYHHAANSGNWECVVQNGTYAAATKADGGVAVAVATKYDLAISWTNTSALFYINGVLVQTMTVPSYGANGVTPAGIGIVKEAGTTNRDMYVDQFKIRFYE